MNRQIYSVTQINRYIKALLDGDRLLSDVAVRGELSNYKCYASGHHYFSLKDGEGAISCVMFRSAAARLRFQPENGMQVVVTGRVAVYPQRGQYQLYADTMAPDGLGELYLAFEQRKEKLYREGLFDSGHKRPLPAYPGTIALITSPSGAAVRDMIRILGVRWPMSRVRVIPSRVQGEEAPGELIAALQWANAVRAADLLIIGRGGGSAEDLWAFQDEGLARAIYASEIPVISAVGHEPDVSISDFVADLRAATPSNAAELAVPDREEVSAELLQMKRRMARAMQGRLETEQRRLECCRESRGLTNPLFPVETRRETLDYLRQRLLVGFAGTVAEQRRRMAGLAASLDALSPLKVLGRGYSVVQDEQGRVLTSVAGAEPGDRLNLRMADGALTCTVEDKEEF